MPTAPLVGSRRQAETQPALRARATCRAATDSDAIYMTCAPKSRRDLRVSCAAVVLLLSAAYASIALAQAACAAIHIKILDIRNSTGSIACALFDSQEGFPIEFLQAATNVMVIKIRDVQARCDFEDIPAGTYAIAVIHDENMNGKLDTNRLGIPREGYGFSNGARAVLSAPSFSAASFKHDGGTLNLSIRLRY